METTRTLVTYPRNQMQVKRHVDPHAWDASKLWNVGLYQLFEWLNNDNLPSGDLDHALKEHLKTHDKYNGLHSQSSQQVLEELADAFNNWLNSTDSCDNPPRYRKQNYYDDQGRRVHEEHPRSTVTWKESAIRHDEQHCRLRLSKGAAHKSSPKAREYIIVHYEKPQYTEIGEISQVRAVWNGDEYEIHIVHEVPIEEESPGDGVAGIDLGICVPAAVAYPDEAAIYPGNTLHEDRQYFSKEEYQTEGPNGPSNRSQRAQDTLAERTDDFRHKLSHEIAETCVEKGFGTVVIGDPSGVEDSDWGRHGNKRLHNWGFAKLRDQIEYKCRERGIEVEIVDERGTSSTCSRCGHSEDACRVDRGLWKCSSCGTVIHGDINGADNIRQQTISVTPPLAETVDSANGCVAQPVVYLFNRTRGFQPRYSVGSCKSEASNPVSDTPNNAVAETGSPPL